MNNQFKKWIYAGCAAGALLFTTACTSNFEEWNTDPNKVPDDKLVGLMKVGTFFPTMELDVIPTSDEGANEYQRAQNLVGDMHSGYVTPIGQWNFPNATQYSLDYDKWNDVAFQVAFTKVMPAWKQIRDNAAEKFPEAYAVAQILKVAAMHRITDIYGPLPYLKFGGTEEKTPYDSQEDIYKSFFTDLNAAINELQEYIIQHPGAKPLAKYDLVYGGDFNQWLKFANSLKLRLAMRCVYTDLTIEGKTPQQLAEEAVATGVITDNTDNAALKSTNGISVYNPWQVIWDMYEDVRMSANMESILKGYGDTRIEKYFQKSSYNDYNGAILGNYIYNKDPYIKLSSPAIYTNSPVQWMCASEIYFLRAEGAIRGWNMGGTAKEMYETGVQSSFAQWGASIGSYLTDKTSKPASFKAQSGAGSSKTTPASSITIAWNEGDGFETKLERIITQKWIAMYPEGQEAWSEVRRTGYPKLFTTAYNYSNGKVDASGPRRLPYPSTEYSNNGEELDKALQTWLGNNDYGKTKLWWDKKN
jgi:hypothetical protein